MNERVGLHRPMEWPFGGKTPLDKNPAIHVRFINGGDNRHRALTVRTEIHTELEHALEHLSPAPRNSQDGMLSNATPHGWSTNSG